MLSAFADAAPALIVGGYSPLPIAPKGLHSWSPGGKEPGRINELTDGNAEWVRLKGWHVFCARQAQAKTIAIWSSYPDAGVGVACGFDNLVAVDIDDEELVEPLLAILPPVLVAKRGRKGLTTFYRSTEPLPSKNYRTPGKRGLIDFLSHGKQTVLPPSIHPDTGKPYAWITERTLLDTSIDELPTLTSERLAAMEDVLRGFGWDAPTPAQVRAQAVARPVASAGGAFHDEDFNRACIAGRSAYLPLLGLGKLTHVSGGWRAIPAYRPSSNGKAEHKRNLNLSIRDSGEIVDHGTGEGFNDISLVARCLDKNNRDAVEWLRITLGIEDGPRITLKPSYRDIRVNLADASARLEEVAATYDAAVQNSLVIRNRAKIDPTLFPTRHPVIRVRSEAGVGKSHIAANHLVAQARLGRHLVYVVPDHKLAAQIRASVMAKGVSAEIYRGYEQDDPRDSTYAMCRNVQAYEAVRALSVSTRSEICERRIDGKIVRCPLAAECGMEWQREQMPQIWIVTSAMLFIKRPDFIPDPDGIVIDESFIDGAMGETVELDLAALLAAKVEGCQPDEVDAVHLWRARLANAVKVNGDGPLSRAALISQDIGKDEASDLGYLERRRLSAHLLRPDLLEPELKTITRRHAKANALARDAATLWQEIETFLGEGDHENFYGDRSLSGRLTVAGSKVSVKPLRTVHQDWRGCPVLILDATAPPVEMLKIVLGEADIPGLASTITSEPDVAAKWSQHVHVRQIVHAPVSMSKLGLAGTPKPDNEEAILRYIHQRAAEAAEGVVGLITYKGLLEQWAGKLPANVVNLHFGNLAGMNNMQSVAGLIVIGRPRPPKAIVEAVASVFAGRPVVTGGAHYDRTTGGIQLADGSVFGVATERHPDPIAEALRWRKTNGELEQAIGRIRPHRRVEPCWLDIVGDVPLPVSVHELVEWSEVAADRSRVGLSMANWRHGVVSLGLSNRRAQETARAFQLDSISISKSIEVESNWNETGYPVAYRIAGARTRECAAILYPYIFRGGEAELRKTLERNGALAKLVIKGRKLKDSSRARAALANRFRSHMMQITSVIATAREIAEADEATDMGAKDGRTERADT